MTDVLLLAPSVPDGIEPAAHYRDLLVTARTDAFERITRLHLDVHTCARDAAADASTALRELRRAAQYAVEGGLDDEDLLILLLAQFIDAIENGDRVLNRSELRIALEQDVEVWEQVEPDALAIGEWATAGYMSFLQGTVRDAAQLQQIDDRARVPLMHALLRAVAAGVLHGKTTPLTRAHLADDFDELLIKTLRAISPVPPGAQLLEIRNAGISACALWNLARIIQRDDMTERERLAHRTARASCLAGICADVEQQRRALHALPEFEYWFDVGVAYASIEPILQRMVEEQDVRMTARPNPLVWINLFGGAGST